MALHFIHNKFWQKHSDSIGCLSGQRDEAESRLALCEALRGSSEPCFTSLYILMSAAAKCSLVSGQRLRDEQYISHLRRRHCGSQRTRACVHPHGPDLQSFEVFISCCVCVHLYTEDVPKLRVETPYKGCSRRRKVKKKRNKVKIKLGSFFFSNFTQLLSESQSTDSTRQLF